MSISFNPGARFRLMNQISLLDVEVPEEDRQPHIRSH